MYAIKNAALALQIHFRLNMLNGEGSESLLSCLLKWSNNCDILSVIQDAQNLDIIGPYSRKWTKFSPPLFQD